MRTPRIPGRLLPHTIVVEPHLGAGAYGDRWGEPVHRPRCLVEGGTHLVTNRSGTEQVASTTVYTEPANIPAGSMVTTHPGTTFEKRSRVITVDHYDHPGGLSHMVLHLE